jgi:hypothetical protein
MLSLFQPIACWQCQMRSLLTRLVGGRLQLCNQCKGQVRLVESGWATWAQVAGAVPPRVSEASKPAKPVQPSAPSIAKVAPPSAAAANVPKADAKRFEPVNWQD